MSALSPALVPTTLWLCAVAGWVVVAAGLWRWPAGTRRKAALTVHALTPPGLVLFCASLGQGLLYGIATATAGWWALAALTRLRPARLLDPAGGAGGLLAAWLGVTVTMTYATLRLLF
ncbi:hypothetical protein DPM19_28090 [Actinomadura craniellae]|uniref:Uncharacterized protein n=1 Tax=Actinomadura craniellae TaxID=2231787 RepID=A0A365GYC3_9ACTN|nr:hypothetical protein DPM19_28090 [Actinomadura craniellae]